MLIGDTCYFIDGFKVIEGKIINKYSHGYYTIKYFKDKNSCGIRLDEKRIFKTKEEAESFIIKPKRRMRSPYEFWH